MRGRSEGSQKKRLLTALGVVAIFLVFLYVYFGSQSRGESALEYGSRSLRRLGSSYLGGDEDTDLGSKQDESSTKFGLEDSEDGIIPKSFPVCDDRHSELIPCLDRNLIYQMRLKLDLTLMEHYERHCPLPERRFNCLIPPPAGTRGSGLAPWPARVTAPPPRLADFGYSNDMFEKDTELWRRRVESYWNLLSPKISSDTLRNLMDMKANLGSFGAALKDKDVWVMNVVPEDGPNTLKLIYDRGLIGSVHNWCEAFSTYPRTYDLLHAWTVFSDIERKGCSAEDLLIEMDRMLRPTGFAIIRDKPTVIDSVKKYLPALHWEAVATADSASDSEQDGDELVFVVQKKLWLTSESFRDSE
ncbi:hypothetical protein RJ639_002349 [Escallonia herrerae]|uniref:Methyltransferase n=1 Tax=Escallonia herrerae TaxID=1293975 RepID=A0AA89BHL5_9ASTE|nr:hypothetical protein RJ639_002349 [Escallonia herrerae]